MEHITDPFRDARAKDGVLRCPFQGESLPMILRHADVREAAKDWQKFSSDAPFRVPIPSEEAVRSMRQLPIETNPPEHGEYRALVEPFFQRAKQPEVIAKVEALIDELLTTALARESLEVVSEFALPAQSRALTYLLNVPEREADVWIGWGIHVFKVTGGEFKKGNVLESYLHQQFDFAEAQVRQRASDALTPDDSLFTALVKATYRGRKLTREEMMGFGNLTFAGGRDTIIYSIANALAYLGRNPEALVYLRADPRRIVHAGEEFFRVFMPLTHIGRVCPVETDVHGVKVPPGGRASLAWASANLDETVFEAPTEIRLDRKPNPHLAFGFGTHLCLGAPHARLIVRTLLQALCDRVAGIEILAATPHVEREATYERTHGFDALTVRLAALEPR
ncbi:MAG: cytochrome P450 [Verrucomicrobia bacterium]|nr:cytochrome P450 [Verrucomicrobiota bacterium]